MSSSIRLTRAVAGLRKGLYLVLLLSLFLMPLSLLFSPLPAQADPGWLTGWDHRMELSINHSLIDSNLTNFPVFVNLTSGNFDFSHANSSGNDIRFTQSDGTSLLYYERERHNSTTEVAEYWVNIVFINSSSNTTFYIYYGNDGVADGEDPTNVWDANYLAVYHLDDPDTGTHVDDSTTNADGTKKGNNEPSQASSIIGLGQHGDGGDDYIDIDTVAGAWAGSGGTLEAWIKQDTYAENQAMVGLGNSETGIDTVIDLTGVNNHFGARCYDLPNNNLVEGAVDISADTDWHYLAMTWDSDGHVNRFLIDGADQGSDSTNAQNFSDTDEGSIFAHPWRSSEVNYFDGYVDETRISNSERNDAWLKASYNSGNDSLLTYGSEETLPPPPAPTTITSPATSIRETSATLHGSLTSLGNYSPVGVFFQYGLSTAYGTNTSIQSRTSTGTFYQVITGLYPGTLYHFRTATMYDTSYVYGSDTTFVSAVAGGSIRQEYYDTGDDGTAQFYAGNWLAQSFTTNSSYTVSSILLELYRAGSPGTITVGIRATNATGCPVGPDLVSGTLSGSTLTTSTDGNWYTVTMSSEYALEDDTVYGIVFRAVAGNINNSGYARFDGSSPTYTGGSYLNSSDGGTSWTINASRDFMFAVYGIPSLELTSAEVFKSYLEDDDWIIVTSYRNTYAPYYPYGSIEDYFRLQLMDDSTMVAQTVPARWRLMPGSIYLSADTVTTLEWGANYTVRIQGTFTGNPDDSYVLTSNDWRGDNLALLDSWCLGLAHQMEDYYDETLVAWSAEKGNVLNEQAGVMFEAGIPELSRVRPGLFQIVVTSPGEDYEDTDFEYTYEEELEDWEASLGPEVSGIIANSSGIIHMGEGRAFGALVIFIIYALVAGMGVVTGHFTAGLTLATPVILVGMWVGLVSLAIMGVLVTLMALMWVRAFWWSST